MRLYKMLTAIELSKNSKIFTKTSTTVCFEVSPSKVTISSWPYQGNAILSPSLQYFICLAWLILV